MKKFFTTTLVLILLLSLTLVCFVIIENRPVNKEGLDILFTIDKGETFGITADHLQKLGLIRSSFFLKILSRITGQQNQIQSGTFMVSSRMSSMRVLSELVSGQQVLYKVTIPEGYTISRIASILHLERVCQAQDFIEAAHNRVLLDRLGINAGSVEGYLYPDTYLFPHNYPADKVIAYMVKTFREKLAGIYPAFAELSAEALHEKVTLASIVEREYRIPEEAPLMASVFYNRLNQHYRLESCATVVYILTEILGKKNPEGAITFADTQIQSPYNTYKHSGLPPGPIANPGDVALHAVFSPASSDYMFFRIIEPVTGRHHFSKTYEEHLNASKFSIKAF